MFPSGVALALAVTCFGGGACVDEAQTGEVRVTYLLQNPDGDELDCATAGVSSVWIALYGSRLDAEPAFEVTVDCETDDEGEGQAIGSHDVGFFDSAQVRLLDERDEVVVMHNGAPAQWEYLTVELTGGGVTDLLPVVTAVFDATAVP